MKENAQVVVQGRGELGTEAAPIVSGLRESQPVLLDLWEPVPRRNEARRESGSARFAVEKPQILDDLLVQLPIARPPAIENQEWIDKEWQIGDQGDVERTVPVERARLDLKRVGEIQIHESGLLCDVVDIVMRWRLNGKSSMSPGRSPRRDRWSWMRSIPDSLALIRPINLGDTRNVVPSRRRNASDKFTRPRRAARSSTPNVPDTGGPRSRAARRPFLSSIRTDPADNDAASVMASRSPRSRCWSLGSTSETWRISNHAGAAAMNRAIASGAPAD